MIDFLNSQEKIYLLVGPMGSGKTSTIYHLLDVMKNGTCDHCGQLFGKCHHREYIIMDFAHIQYPTSEGEAKRIIAGDLYKRLKQALEDCNAITIEDELSLFWKEEMGLIKEEHHGTSAFTELRELITNSNYQLLYNIENIKNTIDINQRVKIRSELFSNPFNALEYYFHLWHYVLTNKFHGNEDNLFIFFDNIDYQNPSIQTAFIQLLQSYVLRPGPRVFIGIRPETLEAAHLTSASNFFGKKNQRGPKPAIVILHHIQRFLDHQKDYLGGKNEIAEDKIIVLIKYFKSLRDILKTKKGNQITQFIDCTCGSSVRLALKIAEGFLYIDKEIMRDINNGFLSYHNIIRRLMIRQDRMFSFSKSQVKAYEPIENLFDVLNVKEGGRFLVKIRILKLLESYNNGMQVYEIRKILRRFNYTETELVCKAINDLLTVQRQLIRSTDKDGYQTVEEFQGSGLAQHRITDIGKGYLKLIGDLDYVESVMYDCSVPIDAFPSGIDISIMSNSLLCVYYFIQTLYKQDKFDINSYLVTNNGYEDYISNIGYPPLSWEIIIKIYIRVKKIITTELINPYLTIDARESREDIIGRFDGLILDAHAYFTRKFGMQLHLPAEFNR